MRSIFEKIRLIRYEEGYKRSRKDFAEIVKIPARTLESIENKGTDPRTSYIQSICEVFPEYTLWMIIDEIDMDSGQISPMIKGYWKKRIFSIKSYNSTNSDEYEKYIDELKFDRTNQEQIEEIKYIIDRFYGGETDLEYPFHTDW